MILEQRGDQLFAWAPAKVNLYLEVLAKRDDGYHEIATAMIGVTLYDSLVFREEPAGRISLDCSDPSLSSGEDNLVVKAARLLQQQTGCSRGATIRLIKRIPAAAGLGGGSADAATTLAALNRLWQLGLTVADLAELAARLGSDLNFFFALPAAWCTGRGEQVAPLHLARPLWLVLLSPPIGLSTAAVYRALTVPARPLGGADMRAAVQQGDAGAIGRCLHNRLQEPARRLCPELDSQLECLLRSGSAGYLLSGSGSSLFALCRDASEARRVARHLRQDPDVLPGSQVFLVRSCS